MNNFILHNKKLTYDYSVKEEFENAGMKLNGYEVKSIQNKDVSFDNAWVSIDNGEAYLNNLYIGKYEFSREKFQERRKIKLLLKKSQILKLANITNKHKYEIIPSYIIHDDFFKIRLVLCQPIRKSTHKEQLKVKDIEKNLRRLKD